MMSAPGLTFLASLIKMHTMLTSCRNFALWSNSSFKEKFSVRHNTFTVPNAESIRLQKITDTPGVLLMIIACPDLSVRLYGDFLPWLHAWEGTWPEGGMGSRIPLPFTLFRKGNYCHSTFDIFISFRVWSDKRHAMG